MIKVSEETTGRGKIHSTVGKVKLDFVPFWMHDPWDIYKGGEEDLTQTVNEQPLYNPQLLTVFDHTKTKNIEQ